MYKKSLLWSVAGLIIIMLSLAGCGKQSAPALPEGQLAEQSGKSHVMRIAANLPVGSYEVTINEEIKKRLEEKVGSQIQVEIYPSGQLGTPPEIIEGIQSGTIQSYLAPVAYMSGVVPGTQFIDLPCLFKTGEQAHAILNNSDIIQELNDDMEQRGFLPLHYLITDSRSFLLDFPLENMDGLKGKRIRTMTTPPQKLEVEAFGASSVPVAPGDVYTALQQGMVDGVCSGIHYYQPMKLYEVAKYYNNTSHALQICPYIVNKAWIQELPVDLQKAVIDTIKEVMPWADEKVKEFELISLEKMKKEGLIEVKASPEFIVEMWEASKIVHDKICKDNLDWVGFYERLRAETEK